MARPNKKTVDYFPHSVKHGKTMFILEQMWGNDGYAFWFKLLELIGSTEHHFVDFNKVDSWEFFIASARIEEEKAVKILDKLSVLDAIDNKAWDNKIVYSQNFCDNIMDAYKRRNNEEPSIYRVYDYINEVYGVKVLTKNLKGKKRKEKESKVSIPPKKDDVISYCKERKNAVDIERWFDFYQSKGWMVGKNKMKDWKAAIRTWERGDSQQPKQENTAEALGYKKL